MPNLLEGREYRKALIDAGFDDIQIENVTSHVLPSLSRLARLLPLGVPIAQLFYKLGVFSYEHLGNVEGSLCQSEALKKGYWQYSFISARKE